MTCGFYHNGNRYRVEISLDGYPSSAIAQPMLYGSAFSRGTGLRNDALIESAEKEGDRAKEEWYEGTVIHAKSSWPGVRECWIDTSDTHGVLG